MTIKSPIPLLYESDYYFLLSVVKSRELTVLKKEDFIKILKSRDISEAISSITTSHIGNYISGKIPSSPTPEDIGKAIDGYLNSEYTFIIEKSPKVISRFVSTFLWKHDLVNIIGKITELILGIKYRAISKGIIHQLGFLDLLVRASNADEIIDLLNKCRLRTFSQVIYYNKELITTRKEENIYLIEHLLYNAYIRELLRQARWFTDTNLITWIKRYIDLLNIKLVLKNIILNIPRHIARNMFIDEGAYIPIHELQEATNYSNIGQVISWLRSTPYIHLAEKLNNLLTATKDILSSMDLAINAYTLKILSELPTPSPISPQPILRYIVLKEVESHLLRLALNSVLKNVNKDVMEKIVNELM